MALEGGIMNTVEEWARQALWCGKPVHTMTRAELYEALMGMSAAREADRKRGMERIGILDIKNA